MAQGKHIVVCGGGIVGLSCAYYLAREGHRVTLIERDAEGHDTCAGGSAGYVSPSHVIPLAAPGMVMLGLKWMMSPRSPFYIKPRLDADLLRWGWLFWRSCTQQNIDRSAPILRDLCLESRKLFVELAAGAGNDFQLEQQGLLNLCKTQEKLDHESHGLAHLANELGVEAQVLDAKATAALDPGVKMDVLGSVYFPIDCHITPRRFVATLSAMLKQQRVEFRFNSPVTGWRTSGGRIAAVQTALGEIEADEFILAGGSWSPGMMQGLGVRLPMQAGKGYSLTLENPRILPKRPHIFTEARVAVTPMGKTLRFGGTMEISGINRDVRPERVQQIIEQVPRYFPEFTPADFAGVKPWHGLRPVSPDGMPYVGRFRNHSNLIAACGHAMLGVTLGPITGLLTADIIAERKPTVALETLNPNRFG
ncbi:MAG: FAD-dependent oxidoreductase [Verrucomicrobia bacterium]|nr:FAD-dependent oxidoreductase [Verrucomicrobiota bacterium]